MIRNGKGHPDGKKRGRGRCDDRRRPGPARDVQHEHAGRAACRRTGMHAVYLYERAGGRHGALRLLPEGGARHVQAPDLSKRHRPRSALGVLGSMPLADLRLAILTGDAAALSRAPGIGKKTAQRISLELKDKLAQDALSGAADWTTRPLPSSRPRPHRTRWERRCWPLSRWDTRRRRRPRRSRASRGRRRRRMS